MAMSVTRWLISDFRLNSDVVALKLANYKLLIKNILNCNFVSL